MVAPVLAAELDVVKSGVSAEKLMPNSNQRVWWRCGRNADHIWEATPNNRFGHGSGCPHCSGAVVSDTNRFSMNCPDPRLLEEWDSKRNHPRTPYDVSIGSDLKVWWKCGVADDHRWQASVGKRIAGRGCPYCAGNRVSSTNRLSSVWPEIARQLDAEASGITADQLSVGSGKVVTWRCSVNPDHAWPASVLNRTGGRKGHGTGCPFCQLVGTSAQELQLKAELAAILRIDLEKDRVLTAEGDVEYVDIVIDGLGQAPGVIVEFDGLWWHGRQGKWERDLDKTRTLQKAGWTVIRVRENPLPPVDPEFDVMVSVAARASVVAVAVLDRMTERGLIPAEQALRYREMSPTGLVNPELAAQLVTRRLEGRVTDYARQTQDEVWNEMCEALGSFASQHGHCRVPDDIEVRGVSLGRWVYKQRTRHRNGTLRAWRRDRLLAISSWSFDSPHIDQFWIGHASYLDSLASEGSLMPRQVTVWASNLRRRRQQLLDEASDLPQYQLDAMADISSWQWNPAQAAFQEKVTILLDYLTETGKVVTDIRQRDQWDDHKIGLWINSWRTRRQRIPLQHQQVLEKLPGWTWDARADEWEEKFTELEKFALAHGHIRPAMNSESAQERGLAVWKRNSKNRLKGKDTDRSRRLRELLNRHGETLG